MIVVLVVKSIVVVVVVEERSPPEETTAALAGIVEVEPVMVAEESEVVRLLVEVTTSTCIGPVATTCDAVAAEMAVGLVVSA